MDVLGSVLFLVTVAMTAWGVGSFIAGWRMLSRIERLRAHREQQLLCRARMAIRA